MEDDPDELPEIEPMLIDPLDLAEKEEDDYLKKDPVARYQFDYNRVTAFANDHPEVNAEPISIAPGEGI